MKKVIILLIFLNVISPFKNLYAQSNPIFSVEHIPNLHFLGMYIGFGQNLQSGKIFPECIDCTFEKGNKFGFTAGVLYEYRLFNSVYLGSAIEYNSLGIDAFFTEIEPVPIQIPINENDYYIENANVKFQHEANLSIHNLSLVPYIKYQPFNFMFIRLGAGIGYNLSNHFVHKKSLAQSTYTLSSGEIVSLRVPNATKNTIIEDTELAQNNPFQIYLNSALGFNINFSEKLTFSPIFSYSNAFMNISERGENPKVNYWRILLELRYDITGDED